MSLNSISLNTIYNHYSSSYATKKSSNQDTHKKSELRSVYNNIIKLNKTSPLFFPNSNSDTKIFAIEMKENASQLKKSISSLNGLSNMDLLNKRLSFSSNENIAQVVRTDTPPSDVMLQSFELGVNSLATPQVNFGNLLADTKNTLPEGHYSFDIDINNKAYEFSYRIGKNDTNKNIQERVARLISNADIGLTAELISDDNDHNALKIQSTETGLPAEENHPFSFTINDGNSFKAAGSVAYLGIGRMLRPPSNAEYTIDGVINSCPTNTILVDDTYHIKLNGIGATSDDVTTIGMKADIDSLSDNVNNLFSSYNSFMNSTATYADSQPKTKYLINDIKKLTSHYKQDLNAVGLEFDTTGSMSINKDTLFQAVSNAPDLSLYDSIREFAQSIIRKSDEISLNPMGYADKKLIAYRNPNQATAVPYITSAYSGMLFNSYC